MVNAALRGHAEHKPGEGTMPGDRVCRQSSLLGLRAHPPQAMSIGLSGWEQPARKNTVPSPLSHSVQSLQVAAIFVGTKLCP